MRRPRLPTLGLSREVSILLPAVTVLMVLMSTFVLLSYRSSLSVVQEEAAGVDRPALTRELERQVEQARRLEWIVVPINAALAVLVLLYLGRLVRPFETLLARARQVAPQGSSQDEVDFLLSTFEQSVNSLSRDHPGVDDLEIQAFRRALARSLESGALLLDREGRVLGLNVLGASLLEVSDSGRRPPLEELLSGHEELVAVLRRSVVTGRGEQRLEVPFRSSRGDGILGLTLHVLRREDGEIRGFLVLFVDLTETQREAERQRIRNNLAHLGELSAGLAHELRNSLATLRGYLQLLERQTGAPDEARAACLADMLAETEHLARVTDDFLSFAKPEATVLEQIPLAPLLARIARDPGLGVPVELQLGGAEELETAGDPHLLERAFRNLLRNAAQAQQDARSAEPVRLSLERKGDRAEVVLEDRGPGLPAPPERLLQPFVTSRPGGVGLGLPLAQRILHLLGAELELGPRPGGGTRVIVSLPLGEDVTKSDEAESGTSP